VSVYRDPPLLGVYRHPLGVNGESSFLAEHVIGADDAPACGTVAILVSDRPRGLVGYSVVCRACLCACLVLLQKETP
jgi:hypothetical protein